jgi:hypothetical protein
MDLARLMTSPPLIEAAGIPGGMALPLPPDALAFLDEHVTASSRTLETGLGMTTALFAWKGAEHVCICPGELEVGRLRGYCDRHGIPLDRVDFRVAASEAALPGIDLPPLDLILLDDCPGLPESLSRWATGPRALRIGGWLVVDDIASWHGRDLDRRLKREREWQRIALFDGRTAVFAKRRDHQPWKEWLEQPILGGDAPSCLAAQRARMCRAGSRGWDRLTSTFGR